MKQLQPNQSPMETDFFTWISIQRMRLSTDNPRLLPFFNTCYYKVLECSIYHRSMGIEITDLQLIFLCTRLLRQNLILYRY